MSREPAEKIVDEDEVDFLRDLKEKEATHITWLKLLPTNP
jgi:hypothetical protein